MLVPLLSVCTKSREYHVQLCHAVDALKKHPTLVSLDLSCNQISTTGGMALLDLLKSCPNLVELEVFNNRIDANTRLKIKRALDENKARH